MIPLRVGSLEDAPLEASKWLKLQMLVDEDELGHLFEALGNFYIFRVGAVLPKGEAQLSYAAFLKVYSDYIACLKKGEIPSDSFFRSYFSSIFTLDPS
jgi:hypothetical protein